MPHPRLAWLCLAVAVLSTACAAPYAIPRYGSDAAHIETLARLRLRGVTLARFDEPAFDASCRGLQRLALPDGVSPGQYIRSALQGELDQAQVPAQGAARVTLSGRLERITSTSSAAITMGRWDLALTLSSSNGRQLKVAVSHDFDSGFHYVEACSNVASAFPEAVKALIGQVLADKDFPELLR